jgi:hypothetical protein
MKSVKLTRRFISKNADERLATWKFLSIILDVRIGTLVAPNNKNTLEKIQQLQILRQS